MAQTAMQNVGSLTGQSQHTFIKSSRLLTNQTGDQPADIWNNFRCLKRFDIKAQPLSCSLTCSHFIAKVNREYFEFRNPSIIYTAYLLWAMGKLEAIQCEKWSTRWADGQSIVGLTQRLYDCFDLCDFGLWEETGTPGGNPCRQKETNISIIIIIII